MGNKQSAADYYPMVKIALADLTDQYPEAMKNYTWIKIENRMENAFICQDQDYLETYRSIAKLFGNGSLTEKETLTIVYVPSKNLGCN